jgi:CRP/FNR family transcriptional regulator, nitrogen fixation regulation protein
MYGMKGSACMVIRTAHLARPIAAYPESKFLKGRHDVPGRAHGEVDPLTQIALTVEYPRNRTIYYEGDEAQHHFKVLSGTVRLCKLTEDGRRQIAAFPTVGDLFGWAGQDTRNYSAEAVTDVILEKYHRRRIEESVTSNPSTGYRVLTMLSSQLTSAHDHFLLLGRMSAAERIAAFLLELARRQGGLGAEEVTSIALPMNRKDIADYLGLTIETVSRTMNAMKRSGLISFTNAGSVRLNHCDGFERFAPAA